jgi:hypothetical protein
MPTPPPHPTPGFAPVTQAYRMGWKESMTLLRRLVGRNLKVLGLKVTRSTKLLFVGFVLGSLGICMQNPCLSAAFNFLATGRGKSVLEM